MSRFIRIGRLESETRFGVFAYWLPNKFLAVEMVGVDFGFFYIVVGDCRI